MTPQADQKTDSKLANPVRISVTEGPLQPIKPDRLPGGGAVILFEGLVRPEEDDQTIEGLRYEVYEPMAQQMLLALAVQTMEQFKVLAIVVEHSRGFVPTFECSFRLQIASKHRAEGLAAMDWFIHRMKQDVPIWKHPRPRPGNFPQASEGHQPSVATSTESQS